MIRSVVLAKLTPGYDAAELDDIQACLRNLNCPGTRHYSVGTDARLRGGSRDFTIVADFDDVTAYRGYDEDAEHNRVRTRPALLFDEVARVQFDIPDV